MALIEIFANDAQTTLAGAITNTSLNCTLSPGSGNLFPSPAAGQMFRLSFRDATTLLQTEICFCTARTGDVCTLIRAQEGTAAQAWSAGDIAANENTAGAMEGMLQKTQAQAGSTNYAIDSGTANSYIVSLTPALTQYADGMAILFKAGNTNTGASTLTVNGLASIPVLGLGAIALQGGEVAADGICTVVYQASTNAFYIQSANAAPLQVAPALASAHAMQLGQATGRLLRTSIYTRVSGVQMVSVNGGAFTATGAGTWTALAATLEIEFYGCGSGASGSGTSSTTAAQSAAGGGGSSGSYGSGILASGFSGSQPITIGAERTGGPAGSAGTAGSATSFGSIATFNGGLPGGVGSVQGVGAVSGSPSASTAPPTGCNVYAAGGQQGTAGINFAGNTSISGEGGSCPFGSGGPGHITVGTGTSTGNPGTGKGAGGGGGISIISQPGAPGGASTEGLLVILERL